VLSRFLEHRGHAITEEEVEMLDALLELPDNDLWDLIAGRAEPADAPWHPSSRSCVRPDPRPVASSTPTPETRP
jgi:succinate dehydrogenase flavin-adding protein (antitoxin of CptAB toxin-antitoxin module)